MQHVPSTRMVRLSEAVAIVESITGDRPHVATIHRWAQRGLKGARLNTAFAGGHRRTTEEWIRQFFAEITKAVDGGQVSLSREERSRPSTQQRAEAELDAAGI